MIAILVLAVSVATTAATVNQKVTPQVAEAQEEQIELETWMGDPSYLDDVVLEEEIELEDWMTDPNYLSDVIDEEEEIVLEDWMGDPNYLN